MVKLTLVGGENVYVNPNHVASIGPAIEKGSIPMLGQSMLRFVNGDMMRVGTSVDDLASALDGINRF